MLIGQSRPQGSQRGRALMRAANGVRIERPLHACETAAAPLTANEQAKPPHLCQRQQRTVPAPRSRPAPARCDAARAAYTNDGGTHVTAPASGAAGPEHGQGPAGCSGCSGVDRAGHAVAP
jgi:hypothetical protein